MSNKDIDQARKLSNNEMEGQKGGANIAYERLTRFKVTAIANTFADRFSPRADSVMCAGQTRSGDLFTNPAVLTERFTTFTR